MNGERTRGYVPLMPCPLKDIHVCDTPCASDEAQATAMERIIRAAARANRMGREAERRVCINERNAYLAMSRKWNT